MITTGNDEGQRSGSGRRLFHTREFLLLVLLLVPVGAMAQNPSMDIYGFAMLDMGQNFRTIHPNWFDTMRVTKLPSFEGQFGENNSTFASVRQTRFGVRTSSPTSVGELKTQFE